MKIGFFTDPHYAQLDKAGTRRPALSAEKLKRVCAVFEQEQVDAIVCLGDWIQIRSSREEMTESLKTLSQIVRETARRMGVPALTCMGNHDREAFTREEFLELSKLQVSPCILEEETEHGLNRLILLDANYMRTGEPWPDHFEDWTETCVPEDQVLWLKEQLQGARCLVAVHQVLDPDIGDNLDIPVNEGHIIENQAQIRRILSESHNVELVMQGHFHWGGEHTHDGIIYRTLEALCEEEKEPYYIAAL
ncbi:MAG: metallophosphoesterase [Lachnospiraceae bacterium]|nr:metallophosphoesterase [Lachnospiraceae bacterium]